MSDTRMIRPGHVRADDLDWQDMGDGTRRKFPGYAPEM